MAPPIASVDIQLRASRFITASFHGSLAGAAKIEDAITRAVKTTAKIQQNIPAYEVIGNATSLPRPTVGYQ